MHPIFFPLPHIKHMLKACSCGISFTFTTNTIRKTYFTMLLMVNDKKVLQALSHQLQNYSLLHSTNYTA